MEFLKDVYGDEALTFAELAERLAGREDVKLANLAGGGYVGAEKYRALNGQVERLQRELAQREQAHAAERDRQALDALVERVILDAGGRNVKAVRALLDEEALAAAEGQQEALEAAVGRLKQEEGYLFRAEAPPRYAAETGSAPLLPDVYRQALGMR